VDPALQDEHTLTLIIPSLSGPYSKFHVGCALLLSGGTIVTGANVENAAYPVGTCAERVAIATAVTQHVREMSFFLTYLVCLDFAERQRLIIELLNRAPRLAISVPSLLPLTFRRLPALAACAGSSFASSAM
jgi:cytidine deaminase